MSTAPKPTDWYFSCQKSPIVHQKSPGFYQKSLAIDPKNSHAYSENGINRTDLCPVFLIWWKQPSNLSKEPYILSREPSILSKEPLHSVKRALNCSEHGINRTEWCPVFLILSDVFLMNPWKQPSNLSKEPYILAKEPKEPYILAKEPHHGMMPMGLVSVRWILHSKKLPSNLSKEPYILLKEPLICQTSPAFCQKSP